ncbi:hypothetical protein ACIOJE_35085 [Kitasatospora sp. NPDC087861]|uniref:hypothetical protein n=1 Tax=Kitasatospora sp. NPDC087861 TaxID=3364070 RepID=UPI0037F1390B
MPVDDHHPEIAAALPRDLDVDLGPYLRDAFAVPADEPDDDGPDDDCDCHDQDDYDRDEPGDCHCEPAPDDDEEPVRLRHDPVRGLDVLRLSHVPRTAVEDGHAELSLHRPMLALMRREIGAWLEAATLHDLQAAGFTATVTSSGPPLTVTGNYPTLHRLADAGLTDPWGYTAARYKTAPDSTLDDGVLYLGPMP